jgi:hypothetical protein
LTFIIRNLCLRNGEKALPFVLKNLATSQLYTCTLINGYRLAYYGTKYWDDESSALSSYKPFLASQEVSDIESWGLLELTENQLKMCNVKVKNDPRYLLYWDEAKQASAASISP